MMSIKEIKNLEKGENVDVVGRISKVAFKISARGTEYCDFTLSDKEGEINAKLWTITNKEVLTLGNVLKVSAQVDVYRGSKQLVVNKVVKLDLEPDQFVVSAIPNVSEVKSDLLRLIESIEDEQMRNICLEAHKENEEKFDTNPAASGCHHAEKFGLLYHTERMMKAADLLCGLYPVNRSVVLTSIFFHDYGKIWEMEPNEVWAGTYVKDSLLGHIYMSATKVKEYVDAGKLDKESGFQIQHAILAHHGKLEYGSPVVPATKEAILISKIDDLDAKMFAAETELLKVEPGEMAEKSNFCLDGARVYNS